MHALSYKLHIYLHSSQRLQMVNIYIYAQYMGIIEALVNSNAQQATID